MEEDIEFMHDVLRSVFSPDLCYERYNTDGYRYVICLSNGSSIVNTSYASTIEEALAKMMDAEYCEFWYIAYNLTEVEVLTHVPALIYFGGPSV